MTSNKKRALSIALNFSICIGLLSACSSTPTAAEIEQKLEQQKTQATEAKRTRAQSIERAQSAAERANQELLERTKK